MTCGLSPYRYSNYSRFKYDVAMWHLVQFRHVLGIVPPAAMFFRFDGEHPFSPVWGHADGVVLQLHAAFDAWACALAEDVPNAVELRRRSPIRLRNPNSPL